MILRTKFEKGYKKDEEILNYYKDEIGVYSNYIDSEIGNLQKKRSEVFFKKGKGYTSSTPGSSFLFGDFSLSSLITKRSAASKKQGNGSRASIYLFCVGGLSTMP
jgi:hypothetical protein